MVKEIILIKPPVNQANERPISALLDQYKNNPANKGLILKTEYVPPKLTGRTSSCLI